MLHYLILAFLISFLISLFIIRLSYKYRRLLNDNFHKGPQRFHQIPAPRLGGIGLILSLLATTILAFIKEDTFKREYFFLFLTAIPAFFIGLLEDLTGKIKIKWRLTFIALSAALAYFLLSAQILRSDLPYIDSLLSMTLIS
ncbi:MAG: glycosyltransferase, partial [Caldimicrobium sp.]